MKTIKWRCVLGQKEVTISCRTMWNSSSYYLYLNEEFLEEIRRKPYQDMRGGIDCEIEVLGEKIRFLVRSEIPSIVKNGMILPTTTEKSIMKKYKPLVEIPVWLARLYTISCLPVFALEHSFILFALITIFWFITLHLIKPTFKHVIPLLLMYVGAMWTGYIVIFLNSYFGC